MDYMELFKTRYGEWLADFDNKCLIETIDNLEQFIDSDIFDNFLLDDEVLALYDMARDECVERIRKGAFAGVPSGNAATQLA